jgi:L-lactate permease
MIDYRVSVIVGIVVIVTALIFRWRKRMTTFRIMFLVGFIYFIGGMIVWNLLGPWLGIVLAALWFVTAFYFARTERRERRSS